MNQFTKEANKRAFDAFAGLTARKINVSDLSWSPAHEEGLKEALRIVSGR